MGHAEDEVTPFLKARRAALDPVRLGLPDGPAKRRVRGLRREEVAQLAGISVDYYTRIEQGRAQAISDAVLDAIARALRLTRNEHTYLRNITQPRRRSGECTPPGPRARVRPQIQELLDAMDESVPAMVYGPGMDILAWNRLATRISFDYDALPEPRLNSAYLVFLHPDAKAFYPDWEAMAEEIVAGLRVDDGEYPDEPRVQQVICELRDGSEEFARLWEAREVRERDHGTKRIRNPEVGELVLTYEAFALPTDPEQRLCTYTAPKGSVAEERLRTLALGVGAR
ncbi:MAG: helix-turn-helix domain-containing protein [Actinophytocola sp.]|uniref:helix-turn-helix domain-containing protein n=1 Tax=Actinophytocola sp. TaxID=1872138 RepID=UPI00132B582E|nr:helix-turn-helix transcriptional regulator [Actinophytocola sp.]MPZ81578.1 helix-turn-helix domain-containing protein [Actinophytocola sp.]